MTRQTTDARPSPGAISIDPLTLPRLCEPRTRIRPETVFGFPILNPGRRPMRLGDDGEPIAEQLGPCCARSHGFNLHAGVTIRKGDRGGLERLCRYLTRLLLSHERHDRLERLDEDHIGLRLKTPYSDGTEQIALTHYELLERLCALVQRPRTHRVRYHGILASASRHRALVVPSAAKAAEQGSKDGQSQAEASSEPEATPSRKRIRRLLWAELIKRTFGGFLGIDRSTVHAKTAEAG